RYVDHQHLHSFPTRRSSDLSAFRWASTVAQEHPLVPELSELVARYDQIPELQRTRELVGQLGRARGILAANTGDENAAEAFGIGDRKSTRLNSSHVSISYAV